MYWVDGSTTITKDGIGFTILTLNSYINASHPFGGYGKESPNQGRQEGIHTTNTSTIPYLYLPLQQEPQLNLSCLDVYNLKDGQEIFPLQLLLMIFQSLRIHFQSQEHLLMAMPPF